MGQMTIGLMLGAALPQGVFAYDDEADDGGLFEAYTRHVAGVCGPGNYAEWWRKRRAHVPSTAEDRNLCGFWVALDRGGDEYGVEEIPSSPIATLEAKFAEPLLAARERWEAFAAWARLRGVEMPAPALWIAQTEVA